MPRRPSNPAYAAAREQALAGRGDPQTAGTLPAAVAARMAKVADQVAPVEPPADGPACECTGADALEHTGAYHHREMVAVPGRKRRVPVTVCSMQTGDMRCPCTAYRPRVNAD